MNKEDLKETAQVILDAASKGVPDLIQHGPVLLVKGDDYNDEYLQLLGPGGETTPGGFHRALSVRHARYIALVTQAAVQMSYRLLEVEKENEELKQTCQQNKRDIEVKEGDKLTLDDLIREFERANFHHVNDTIHRMGISEFSAAYCSAVVRVCVELKAIRSNNGDLGEVAIEYGAEGARLHYEPIIEHLEVENERLRQELHDRPSRERLNQMKEKSRKQWRECARLELELGIWKERVDREQNLTEHFRSKIEEGKDMLKSALSTLETLAIKGFHENPEYIAEQEVQQIQIFLSDNKTVIIPKENE